MNHERVGASRKNFPFRLISRGASDYFESSAADLLNGLIGFGLWSQASNVRARFTAKWASCSEDGWNAEHFEYVVRILKDLNNSETWNIQINSCKQAISYTC